MTIKVITVLAGDILSKLIKKTLNIEIRVQASEVRIGD